MALVAVPAALIVFQPDLGTAVMVAGGGVGVMVFSGVRWRILIAAGALAAVDGAHRLAVPARLSEEPRIDVSRSRTGSAGRWLEHHSVQDRAWFGGFAGKGLFGGTQSQLEFLPEAKTDFIIAVVGEELGLLGAASLLALYLVVIARALFIAARAADTFGRLAAASLTLVFFGYVFVNIAMVSGMLPVVGVPLPLVSYGGTSIITLLIGFGIVMSIHTHRRW